MYRKSSKSVVEHNILAAAVWLEFVLNDKHIGENITNNDNNTNIK